MAVAKKRMTKEEKEKWNELYEYVRKNVLGYDENQALSKTMVLRLKGLLTNKFIENHNIEDGSHYSYEVVLNTFKFCSSNIQRVLMTKNFDGESYKFNYILKIIEGNLNDVYMKMKNIKKVEDKIKIVDTSIVNNNGVKYARKETKKDKFNELW